MDPAGPERCELDHAGRTSRKDEWRATEQRLRIVASQEWVELFAKPFAVGAVWMNWWVLAALYPFHGIIASRCRQ